MCKLIATRNACLEHSAPGYYYSYVWLAKPRTACRTNVLKRNVCTRATSYLHVCAPIWVWLALFHFGRSQRNVGIFVLIILNLIHFSCDNFRRFVVLACVCQCLCFCFRFIFFVCHLTTCRFNRGPVRKGEYTSSTTFASTRPLVVLSLSAIPISIYPRHSSVLSSVVESTLTRSTGGRQRAHNAVRTLFFLVWTSTIHVSCIYVHGFRSFNTIEGESAHCPVIFWLFHAMQREHDYVHDRACEVLTQCTPSPETNLRRRVRMASRPPAGGCEAQLSSACRK